MSLAPRIRAYLGSRAVIPAAMLLLPTFLAFVSAETWWLAEQLNPFRVQYALAGVFLAALSRWGSGKGGWVAAVVVVVNLACILPLYTQPSRAASAVPPLRVMSFNIQSENWEYDAVRAQVREHAPDVAIIIEVTRPWVRELKRLEGYEEVISHPEPGHFGVMVLSRVPMQTALKRSFSTADLTSLEVSLDWHGRTIKLLGTHTMPPFDARTTALRRSHLDDLVRWSQSSSHAYAIFGDLNATPFSGDFDDLLQQGNLHRAATGLRFTWPAKPMLWPLSIELDHGLLGPDLVAVGYEVGQAAGSDHRPVIVDLTFAE